MNHSIFFNKIKKYLTNSLWILSENLLRLITGFFVGIYVARYLGPGEFGAYNYSLSILTIMTPFLKLGIDNILVKEFVNNKESSETLISTSFVMKSVAGIILTGLLLVGYAIAPSENALFVLIMSIGYIFQSLEVIGFYFQSIHENKKVTQCKLIQLAVSSLVKIIAIKMGCALIVFVCLYTIDLVMLYLTLFLFYKKSKNVPRLKINLYSNGCAKKLFLESWPFILSGFAGLIYMRVDQIMIKNMISETALGEFSAAVRLSEVIYMLPNLILIVLFPVVTKVFAENKEKYIFIVRRLFDLMVVLALTLALPISIFANDIISMLYGSAYSTAGEILSIHVFCSIFVFIGIANSTWVINEKLGKITIYRTVLAAIINIVLNFFLIPKYGPIGAAYATCISQFMASIGFNVISRSTRPWFYRQMVAVMTCGVNIYKWTKVR
ncbi:flippase [Escherichia coli]|uniref:flippase n=1 Tax=Enterobacteriaceae TaxID=543 RepID=UPI000BDE89D3|nr:MULTISPECIES: flippase [Enterobacteriaceae]ELW2698928.1 flippase [Escherichia coli O26]EES4585823.1 flippase [Escherichia coli]EEV8808397.1 flippase [Escherichia coli]EFB8868503.1 flippase [Escherichia coli]EFE1503138.1 flippase [Escherichia coli]